MEIKAKTIIRVEDVLFQDSGHKRAFIQYIHNERYDEFLTFRKKYRGNEFEQEHYKEDFDKFAKSLNLEIKNEFPHAHLKDGRYVIDIDYEIYEYEKNE